MAYQSFFAKTTIVNVAPRGGATGATGATGLPPVSSKTHVDTQPVLPYNLILTIDEAKSVLKNLAGQQVAFDLETTGLDPLSDEARLLSIAPLQGEVTSVIDLFEMGGLRALKDELIQMHGIVHNAAFDLAFLTSAGATLALTDCTMISAHIAGSVRGNLDLATLSQKYLGRAVDKSQQKSNWRGHLSETQIAYAAKDAELARDLWFTHFRGHQKFGDLKFEQIKWLTDLEMENGRLRRAVADLTLNKFIFNEDAWDPQGSASKTAEPRVS